MRRSRVGGEEEGERPTRKRREEEGGGSVEGGMRRPWAGVAVGEGCKCGDGHRRRRSVAGGSAKASRSGGRWAGKAEGEGKGQSAMLAWQSALGEERKVRVSHNERSWSELIVGGVLTC